MAQKKKKKKSYISVDGPPRDDYEPKEKYRKEPSVTCLKRKKWRVYRSLIQFPID